MFELIEFIKNLIIWLLGLLWQITDKSLKMRIEALIKQLEALLDELPLILGLQPCNAIYKYYLCISLAAVIGMIISLAFECFSALFAVTTGLGGTINFSYLKHITFLFFLLSLLFY
jgi:hypothetical protein